jgi:hypothetical protein
MACRRDIEGIVFYHPDGRMAKIKLTRFRSQALKRRSEATHERPHVDRMDGRVVECRQTAATKLRYAEYWEWPTHRSDTMCDYSLEHVESRPAKVGDQLVSTVFSNSFTRGFSAIGEPDVAVCLLPGTELVFERDVECDHVIGFFPTKRMGDNTARFRRIDADRPHQHHDALEFPSGRIVHLTRLVAGQRATVLQLPVAVAPQAPAEMEPAPAAG